MFVPTTVKQHCFANKNHHHLIIIHHTHKLRSSQQNIVSEDTFCLVQLSKDFCLIEKMSLMKSLDEV